MIDYLYPGAKLMKFSLVRLLPSILFVALFAASPRSILFAQEPQGASVQAPPAPNTPAPKSTTGILLMAHGGKPDWNRTVLAVAAETNKTMPTEVAFGMADRESLQEGIDKLVARGVTQIVAVPLFVSSHSIVIDSTKYLLGICPDAPKGFADLIDSMPDMKDLSSAAKNTHAPSAPPTDSPHTSTAASNPATPSSSTPSSASNPNSAAAKNQFAMLPPNSGSTDPNNPPPDPVDQDAIDRANHVMDYSSMTSAKMPTADTGEDTDSDTDASSTSAKSTTTNSVHAHRPHGTPPIPPPVQSSVPIRMTSALDHHAVVAEILSDRAAAIAKNPARNVLILVAHGPNDDAENSQWLADMRSLAKQVAARQHYARIECATLRDDAPAAVRDAATAELREKVQDADNEGYHAIVVPLLLSYGGIENGLRERLDGVEHILSSKPLLPDPRIAQWVLSSASSSESAASASK
jgi:sirohydrochlorin ferrochelatase